MLLVFITTSTMLLTGVVRTMVVLVVMATAMARILFC